MSAFAPIAPLFVLVSVGVAVGEDYILWACVALEDLNSVDVWAVAMRVAGGVPLLYCARTDSNVHGVGIPRPLPNSPATVAQHAKLDDDFRSSASLGIPSV
jgi:hypothetical protein